MHCSTKTDFQQTLSNFSFQENVIIKPNWVSNEPGEFSEPVILDWLLSAFPSHNKIIIESYTPWRGFDFKVDDLDKSEVTSLEGGKNHWELYKKQDEQFLSSTGIEAVLKKHNASYLNITNEVWQEECVDPQIIKRLVEKDCHHIKWEQLFSYIPKKLFEIRENSTLISLSKIKIEESIPEILVSMSMKNLFGLIPHPSRWVPFHENGHADVANVIKDLYKIYSSIFDDSVWIAEGILTMVKHYCEPTQEIVRDQGLLFVGKNAIKVDSMACEAVGIDPKQVPHLVGI